MAAVAVVDAMQQGQWRVNDEGDATSFFFFFRRYFIRRLILNGPNKSFTILDDDPLIMELYLNTHTHTFVHI